MRRRWVAAPITVLMAAVLLGAVPASARPTSPRATGGKVRVKIVNFAFKPASASVPVGTVVVWINRDTVSHTTTSDTGAWNSGTLAPGARFKHRFKLVGTFTYHCTIHAQMTASITVTSG
jgi:plastocyanin